MDIEDSTFESVDRMGDWKPDHDPYFGGPGRVVREEETYFRLDPEDLTEAITPYLTELGAEGWEVIDYKFSTESIFAQAMLKRKINS